MTDTDTRPSTREVVARALYDVERGASCSRIVWDDLTGEFGEQVRQDYLQLADAALAAMRRGDDLPDPDEIGTDILDADRVARIAWFYDPAGTLYNDVHRLARSHENLRNERPVRGASTLGELLWLIAYFAHHVPAELTVPPRFAHLVEGAAAIYQPGRYTLSVPIGDIVE